MVRRLLLAAGLFLGLAAPAAAAPSPPGANDWNCRPDRAHHNPVVLVHGTAENRFDNWLYESPRIKAAGYCVFALDYGAYNGSQVPGIFGLGPIAKSASELSAFVDRVLGATHAKQVDMVGHSQGGMMPRQYLKFLGGTKKVDDLIGLVPSNHGTDNPLAPPLGLTCPACVEQVTNSPFLRRLNAGDETPGRVSYTVITTTHDEVVTPYTSALLKPGQRTTNLVVQSRCPGDLSDHLALPYDTVALQYVLDALRRPGPASPRLVPRCS